MKYLAAIFLIILSTSQLKASNVATSSAAKLGTLKPTESPQEPDIFGDFSDAGKDSIKSMINHINNEVSDFYSEDDDLN